MRLPYNGCTLSGKVAVVGRALRLPNFPNPSRRTLAPRVLASYYFTQLGGRFSLNAAMPSRASAELRACI